MAKEITVKPHTWTPRGEALAPVRGRPTLVWQGIPDEPAQVRLVAGGQHQAVADRRAALDLGEGLDEHGTLDVAAPGVHLPDLQAGGGGVGLVPNPLAPEGLFAVVVDDVRHRLGEDVHHRERGTRMLRHQVFVRLLLLVAHRTHLVLKHFSPR